MVGVSEAQLKAQAKYDKRNTKQITLKLNLNTDADVIERLESIPLSEGGKQGYIKALIRKDIKQNP